jgi:immune inhibitor A
VQKLIRRAVTGLVAGALAGSLLASAPTGAVPPPKDAPKAAARSENRPGPLTSRQEARNKAARQKLRTGEATANADGVVQLAADKYAQPTVSGVDRIFTVLAEFGDAGSGKLGTTPGPVHNQIAAPDRTVDNSTLWRSDFSRQYYEDLFFGPDQPGGTFKDFYETQSSGSYTIDGDVSDWVKVPGNASTYGDNAVEDFGGSWQFIADAADAWWAAGIAAGQTPAQLNAYLASFDVWDRYDHDDDGNFAEPDGYLDHFQAIHAGEGEEGNGGEDAIWSHRWYVNGTDYGLTGPVVGGQQVKFGGTQVGDSNLWIGDYTTEPENGGLGVFTHEFGHDLGLPDLYDTAGGDNGTGFWTLMSGGSWMNLGQNDIGSTPSHMGPWEKLQLGWLDYQVVGEGANGTASLEPASAQTDGTNAVIVDVPDLAVSKTYNAPYSGANEWWSGSADDLNNTLTRTLPLTGVSKATVTAKAWYQIEAGYDFLYAEVSRDGGTSWTQLGTPITGSTKGHWTNVSYTIPGGQDVLFRFRYQTDGGVSEPGAFLDDITVKNGGTTLLFDDVESGTNGWTANGWTRTAGSATVLGDRYYLGEYRAYTDYDRTLQLGPYNFSRGITAPNWVDRFPYQDGLLVWAVDETYADNNTSEHPGHGLVLPVDARPGNITYADGVKLGNRRQPFDATFGLQTTDPVTFRREVLQGTGKQQRVVFTTVTVGPNPAIPTFTDKVTDAYWSAANPLSSALVAGYGSVITVTRQTSRSMTVTVDNTP